MKQNRIISVLMTKKRLAYLLATVIVSALTGANVYSQSGSIFVKVEGFESSKGQAIFRVYNSPEGFPRKLENVYRVLKKDITSKKCSIVISDLPPGEYAIVIYHDENKNGKLDTNWIGMPKEALGTSNYSEMARPEFEKAKLSISSGEKVSTSATVNKIF